MVVCDSELQRGIKMWQSKGGCERYDDDLE
jgi:hypothetical protein